MGQFFNLVKLIISNIWDFLMLCIRNILQIIHVYPTSNKKAAATVSANFSSKDDIGNITVNKEEVTKFQTIAAHWWNEKTFNGLKLMNEVRVPFVRDGLLSLCLSKCDAQKPLKGFTILDVGCGGGFLSEPLARLGADVTGLDPVAESIKTARSHAEMDNEIKNNLKYVCGTVEEFSKGNQKYDAVVCSEVIEHVDNVEHFVKCCAGLVKDKGSIFITTINRTVFAYFYAIIFLEYVIRVIPIGTHDWKKFVRPNDLKRMLQSHNCTTRFKHGMIYYPIIQKWVWSVYDGSQYLLHAVKDKSS